MSMNKFLFEQNKSLGNPSKRWAQTNHFKQFSFTIIQVVRK